MTVQYQKRTPSLQGLTFLAVLTVALGLAATACLGVESELEPAAGTRPPAGEAPEGGTDDVQRPAGVGVHVDTVEIQIMESFPLQAQAVIGGNFSDGCTTLEEVRTERTDDTFTLNLFTSRPPDVDCTEALVPFTETVPLDIEGLAAGTYTVEAGQQAATFTLDVDNVLPDGG